MSRVTKQDLAIAQSDASYWRKQYDLQHQSTTEISRIANNTRADLAHAHASIAKLQAELVAQKRAHEKELVDLALDCANKARNIIDLRITEAERDTAVRTFKYLADSVVAKASEAR